MPPCLSTDLCNPVLVLIPTLTLALRLIIAAMPGHALISVWLTGVWTPLYLMYPEADIPVIPLSVHNELDAQMHITAGELPCGASYLISVSV